MIRSFAKRKEVTDKASIRHKANDGTTALAAAKNEGDAELVALLEKSGAQ